MFPQIFLVAFCRQIRNSKGAQYIISSELLYFCQQHLCLNDVQWREKKNLKSESKAAEANMSKDYAPQPKR